MPKIPGSHTDSEKNPQYAMYQTSPSSASHSAVSYVITSPVRSRITVRGNVSSFELEDNS